MQNNILKNVKKVFQLVKTFLVNLILLVPNNSYICMYSMTPIFLVLFAYEEAKQAEFLADFKSVEIIGKKCTQEKLFAKNFCKLLE